MSQRENATGIDPAARRAEPSLRAEIVAVTWRETPCMVRYPVMRTVMTAPEVKAELSVTGSESVNLATGSSLVPRLVANCPGDASAGARAVPPTCAPRAAG